MADNIISQLSKYANSFTRSRIRDKTIYQSFDLNRETLETIITMCYYYSIENFDYEFKYHHNTIESIKIQGIVNRRFYQTNWLTPTSAISWLFKLYQAIYMKEREGIDFILRHIDWLSVSNKLDPTLLEDFDNVTGTIDIAYRLENQAFFYDNFVADLHDNQEPYNSRTLLDEALRLRLNNDDELINFELRGDLRQELDYNREIHGPNRNNRRLRRRPQRYGFGLNLLNSFRNESIKLNRLLNMKNLNLMNDFLNSI